VSCILVDRYLGPYTLTTEAARASETSIRTCLLNHKASHTA